MSALRTEELRQRLEEWVEKDCPCYDCRLMREAAKALAVLEEQNKMWQEKARKERDRTNEFARMESESQSRVAVLRERVRLLEAAVEAAINSGVTWFSERNEARRLAVEWRNDACFDCNNPKQTVRDIASNRLPWEASVSGSSPAPQKEETK